VTEEIYDFRNDPDGLINLIDAPDIQNEIRRLKNLLHSEMKRSKDPLVDEFEKRFLK